MRFLLATARRGALLFALSACWAAATDACAAAPHYAHTMTPAPYAGPSNYAHQTAPFYWGWFGAETFTPRPQWRRDYNNELMRWNQYRRY